jgi:hypothetical protein
MLRDTQTIGALVPQMTAVLYFRPMAPKKTTVKEIAEMLAHVVKHMATKEDIADVKSTLADHTKILNNHTRDLAIIKKDLTTNLDKRLQLEVRVSAIEKHLGLDKKIAA